MSADPVDPAGGVGRVETLTSILEGLGDAPDADALLRHALDLLAGPPDEPGLAELRQRYVTLLVGLGRDRDATEVERMS